MTKYIVYTKEKGKIETDNWRDFECLTRHRVDGSAMQRFHDNGQLTYKAYFINDKLHRLDGPAYQTFHDNGELNHKSYYINGIYYSKFEYDVEIFKMKLALL